MDTLLLVLFAAPLAGSLATAFAGHAPTWRNRALRTAALCGTLISLGVMAAVVYRRFFVPLGAMQLRLEFGDWFRADPLWAVFSLRMDTLAGVICLVMTAGGVAFQALGLRRRWDGRLLAASGVLLSVNLIFVLSDNLIPAFAALVSAGPLLAIMSWWRVRPGLDHERHLPVLFFHGAGDALALVGILLIQRAIGVLSYRSMGAEIAAMAAPSPSLQWGVTILLLGVAVRSGPELAEALAPIGALVYLGYRLDSAVRTVPGWVMVTLFLVAGFLAAANLAGFVHGSDETARLRRVIGRHAGPFFRDFLDEFVLVGTVDGIGRLATRIGARLGAGLRRPVGAAAGVALVAFVAWMVTRRAMGSP